MLHLLGADEALRACEPCYGIASGWGRSSSQATSSIFNPHGNSWFVHRKRFDAILRKSAHEAGALWVEGMALAVGFETDAVTISTDTAHVRGKWLIIAAGAPAWTARITGQKLIKYALLTAFWARISHHSPERLLLVEPSEFGWWYLCPDDGPGSVACLITDPRSARDLGAGNLSNWNNLFSSTQLSRGRDETATERVFATTTGIMSLSNTQGRRWIAVGDAAAKLDPLGSSGIMTALDAGRKAARAIHSSLNGNAVELPNYQKWSAGLVREFTRQREQRYSLEATKHSGHFWHRDVNATMCRVN